MSDSILDATTGVSYATVSAGSNTGDLIRIPAGTHTNVQPVIQIGEVRMVLAGTGMA